MEITILNENEFNYIDGMYILKENGNERMWKEYIASITKQKI